MPVVTRRIQFAPDQPELPRPVSKDALAAGDSAPPESQVFTLQRYASPGASAGPPYGTYDWSDDAALPLSHTAVPSALLTVSW